MSRPRLSVYLAVLAGCSFSSGIATVGHKGESGVAQLAMLLSFLAGLAFLRGARSWIVTIGGAFIIASFVCGLPLMGFKAWDTGDYRIVRRMIYVVPLFIAALVEHRRQAREAAEKEASVAKSVNAATDAT